MQEFPTRRGRVAERLAELRLDALLVSSAANIRYLAGFTGSNALLLVIRNRALLFTDPRYEIQAFEESDCEIRVERGPLVAAVSSFLRRSKLRRLAFEQDHLTFKEFHETKAHLPAGSRISPTAGLVEALRMVKSPAEIESIRRSVALNSQAFEYTLRGLRPGIKETEVAAELEYRMRRLGADKPAFETIVASGERSALPHAQPTEKTLGPNQLLLIDMGATVEGYTSDMTRVAYFGKPSRKVTHLYRAVLEAQLAAIDAVRGGVTAGEIDRVARIALGRAGLDSLFVHSTGHGLGLEVHEPPKLGLRDITPLQPGMAITIEPGVYLQGFGGVRIEDTVLVTEHGCEVLTPTSKELWAL